MKARIAIVILLTCAGVAASAGRALAQDSTLARAEEHFNKGQALFENAKYQEAAIEFQTAYESRPLPPFLFNIGASYEKLAKSDPGNLDAWDKAISYYRRYVEADPKAQDKKKVERRIALLESELARIKKESGDGNAPTEVKNEVGEVGIRGLVVVESEPQNAFIYLDDKKKGPLSKTPWSGTLEGEHTIYIERKGYKPQEKTISPSPDKLIVLSIGLAQEDYLGWVDITSNVPGANVYIDDKSVGVYRTTPFSGNLKPGKHKIWISTEGYDEYYTEVDIVPGQTHEINAKLVGAPVGYVNIRGDDMEKATVYLDGKVLCKRGPCREAVREGRHRIRVERSGYKPYVRTIEVQPKTEITLRTKLARKPGRGDAIWAYAFSAAFAGGGYFLGTRSQKIHDELAAEIEAGSPPVDSADPRFERGRYFTYGADAAYVLSGTTFLMAVYYTFRDKGPKSKGALDVRAVALEPQLAPGYAGLGMEVSW